VTDPAVWAPYAVGAVLFASLCSAVLALAWPRTHEQRRIRQIVHFGPRRRPVRPANAESVGATMARSVLAASASVVRVGGMEARVSLRLERAGMRLRAHEWVLLRTGVAVGLAVGLFLAGGWLAAAAGLVVGWLLTTLYQTVRADRRSGRFAEQLPDALQLVVGSLRSGFSLPQALDTLVRESPEPVASDFGRALAEHRLGADLSDALERVAHRTRSEDLGWAVMATRIQREVGGNLAEVLQTTVDTMRERARLRRHVRALSAEGRLSAIVLIGLPIALALFMFVYRADYLHPLVTDPLGVTLLVGGSLLLVVGIFWMLRIIRVEP
jgi:Flp pilus assembly protein TadB